MNTPKKSSADLLKAAVSGSVTAQYELGRCYELGEGEKQSFEQALKWYTRSATHGGADANIALARMYETGTGVEKSLEKALEYCRNAQKALTLAKNNCSWSEKWNKEKIIEKKIAELKALLGGSASSVAQSAQPPQPVQAQSPQPMKQEVKEKGAAEYELGEKYYNGKGAPQSYERAVEWYRKAAEQGYTPAQFALGNCYENGCGVLQSYEKAVEFYRKAAEKAPAYLCSFVAQNKVKELSKFLSDSAATKPAPQPVQPPKPAPAQSAQPRLIYTTKHVNTVQEYLAALDMGYRVIKIPEERYADLLAVLRLKRAGNDVYTLAYARMLLNGWGCKKDADAAYSLIRPLAESGDAWAQNMFAFRYFDGIGVPKSHEKAAEWWQKAAEQGEAWAQYNLGNCYDEGARRAAIL